MSNPKDSRVNTIITPPVGTQAPATLYVAAESPIRVVVRNTGGTVQFISHDSATLQGAPPLLAGTFQLPPGASETFVLQPRQGIYAASSGGGGQVSIAVSEALPMRWMEA